MLIQSCHSTLIHHDETNAHDNVVDVRSKYLFDDLISSRLSVLCPAGKRFSAE